VNGILLLIVVIAGLVYASDLQATPSTPTRAKTKRRRDARGSRDASDERNRPGKAVWGG
jgi:hypothetical protein